MEGGCSHYTYPSGYDEGRNEFHRDLDQYMVIDKKTEILDFNNSDYWADGTAYFMTKKDETVTGYDTN